MSDNKSNPPRAGIWLLRHACPGGDNEALAGDLVERFREGRSHGWFWKQVLNAIVVGVVTKAQRLWPQVCYAIAGMAILLLFEHSIEGARNVVRWWVLPWPFSMLVDDLIPDALVALSALPVLAVALVINGTFRWVSLLRTWLVDIFLFAIHQYAVLALVPGPFRLAVILWVSMYFLIFLVSAWLGCWSPRRTTPLGKPAENRAV